MVLVGVEPPYREALAARARAARLDARVLPAEPRAGEGAAAPVLCVAALAWRGADAAERVRRLRARFVGAPLVALAKQPALEEVVHLVRAGACDVVALPAEARSVAARSLAHRLPDDGLVGHGAAMQAVRARLRRVAARPTTVLLTGETGTGKGEAARLLHEAGAAPDAPFAHLDCAALAPGLIESELFGHERGAFTGALARRRGRLEEAGAGTLFLDEIAELPLPLQGRLLRALQDRRFERLGGGEPLTLRARIVAASHVDLPRAVAAGRFRADLLYRLDVARVALPPLRARLEDLPALVAHGLARLAARLGMAAPAVTPALRDALAARPWPGNVRELLNVLERLLVLTEADPLDACHLREVESDAAASRTGGEAAPPVPAAREAGAPRDASVLAATLREAGGNVSRAARRLGVPRSTLRARIARAGLGHLIPRD
ncbi:MAG: sigma-54 dependent transcriptional regulator [Myxococcota bacterium]|nr:sigma-54 dependent transcriptional regulator [Myxococcota bacterium]